MKIKVFTKEGCPPCKQLIPVISEFENVELLNALDYIQEYGLRQAPSVLFFKDDKEIGRFVGFKTKQEITSYLESL